MGLKNLNLRQEPRNRAQQREKKIEDKILAVLSDGNVHSGWEMTEGGVMPLRQLRRLAKTGKIKLTLNEKRNIYRCQLLQLPPPEIESIAEIYDYDS